MQHGLEEGVAVLEELVLRYRLALGVEGVAGLAGQGLHARVFREVGNLRLALVEPLGLAVREHDALDKLAAHALAHRVVGGEPEHRSQALDGLGADRRQLGLVDRFVSDEVVAVGLDSVRLLPGLDLLLRAVARGVGGRVPRIAVGDGVHEHRAAALEEELLLARHGVRHGEGIVAVDALRVHILGIHAGADAGEYLVAHRLARCLAAHAIEVVEEVEEDGRGAAQVLVPERAVLVHRGEAHRLPDGAAAHRGVSDVGDHDAALAVDPLVEGRARRDIGRAAHDRVVRHRAEGREEGVHRAAEAAGEAGLAREYFSQGAVEDEGGDELRVVLVRNLLGYPEGLAAPESLHGPLHRVGRQLARGGEALGQDLAVAAVRAEDEVVRLEAGALADRGGLLAGGKVGGAAMVVLDAVPGALGLDLVQHGLELAHSDHVGPYRHEPVGAEARQLGLVVGLVLIDGYARYLELTRLARAGRVYDHRLGHDITPLIRITRREWLRKRSGAGK